MNIVIDIESPKEFIKEFIARHSRFNKNVYFNFNIETNELTAIYAGDINIRTLSPSFARISRWKGITSKNVDISKNPDLKIIHIYVYGLLMIEHMLDQYDLSSSIRMEIKGKLNKDDEFWGSDIKFIQGNIETTFKAASSKNTFPEIYTQLNSINFNSKNKLLCTFTLNKDKVRQISRFISATKTDNIEFSITDNVLSILSSKFNIIIDEVNFQKENIEKFIITILSDKFILLGATDNNFKLYSNKIVSYQESELLNSWTIITFLNKPVEKTDEEIESMIS